jgi:hypothetical protein
MQIQEIFDKLWTDYTTQNHESKKIYDSFIAEGENVENDHIAFRTFFDTRINVDVLARPFLNAGYEQKGYYTFEDKHLTAKHYEHETLLNAPRVFISQLMTEHFSPQLQSIVKQCTARVPDELVFGNELIFSGNVWGPPSYETYEMLRKESEYAAWLYVYGFVTNHFTVSINSLKKYDTIQKVNQFIKDKGFLLNSSGGEIKGTLLELLEQSSTKAGFLPDTDGKLYSGFRAKSADKIFESTDFYKK